MGVRSLNTEPLDLLVLGAGPAGLNAALSGHRAGLRVLVLGGDAPGGQVALHSTVDNFPGFPGGVTGAELMARWLQQVVDETGAAPDPRSVTRVDFAGDIKQVFTADGSFAAKAVVIATGSKPRRLGVPRELELQGKAVYYCATCDGPLLRTMERRRAAVIGGGETAVCTALALLPHAESVTVITRGAKLAASHSLVKRLQTNPSVRVLTHRTVKTILGDKRAEAVLVQNVETKDRETIHVEAVFVGIGPSPVTEFLQGAVSLDEQGFIVTDTLLRTSVPGVYAAGDVRVTPLRQIVTAAADGALAAHAAAQYLERQEQWHVRHS